MREPAPKPAASDSVLAPAARQLFAIHAEGFLMPPTCIFCCRKLARSTCFSYGSCCSSVFALSSRIIMTIGTACGIWGTVGEAVAERTLWAGEQPPMLPMLPVPVIPIMPPPIPIGLQPIPIEPPPIALGLPPGMLSDLAPAARQLFTIHPEGFMTVPPWILACRKLANSTCFSSGSCCSNVLAFSSMMTMTCCKASGFDGTEPVVWGGEP
mmetsp:Transcript_6085/g.16435  ORF Transcript_6085/g.16435 Transcript_6085/m.16435 type:complete len:211 (-) Transcript_6085:571-1203(-)